METTSKHWWRFARVRQSLSCLREPTEQQPEHRVEPVTKSNWRKHLVALLSFVIALANLFSLAKVRNRISNQRRKILKLPASTSQNSIAGPSQYVAITTLTKKWEKNRYGGKMTEMKTARNEKLKVKVKDSWMEFERKIGRK